MHRKDTVMGHWCKICKRVIADERFSGKDHRIHVCKKCSLLPFAKRSAIEQKDEIFDYLPQSNISQKNMTRLKKLLLSLNSEISELASIVLEVGRVRPYKRRRLKFLAAKHQNLLEKLEATELIFARHY